MKHHVVFIGEDHDPIVKSFETREQLDEFRSHFEDVLECDFCGECEECEAADNEDFWRLGYEPKHILIHGDCVEDYS